METNKILFSNNLKYLMAINNKTRHDLSKELGISYTTICDWVNGNVIPRSSKQDKIAKVLGVSVSRLFEEPKEKLLNSTLKNSFLLDDYIKTLARDEEEAELLINCTMLGDKYRKIISEQVEYYLSKQSEEFNYNKFEDE